MGKENGYKDSKLNKDGSKIHIAELEDGKFRVVTVEESSQRTVHGDYGTRKEGLAKYDSL